MYDFSLQRLTKGTDSWSLAEVVHAIVLLAHFHSLSSFVFSCGINEELDNPGGHHYKENIQDLNNTISPIKDKILSSSPKHIANGVNKNGKFIVPILYDSLAFLIFVLIEFFYLKKKTKK